MASMSEVFYRVRNECKNKENETSKNSEIYKNDTVCGWIWDGIMCWPKTPAGVELALPCPEYFGFSSKTNATKKCTENGTWFVHEELNKTWTNFSECTRLINNDTAKVDLPANLENLAIYHLWFPKIKTINYIGYSLSITTLVIAITIFCCFKKLQCARNRLHMHLFFSFFLKGAMFVMKEFLFVKGTAMAVDVVTQGDDMYVKEHNFWFCKAVTSFLQYVIITNYMLILMEGIYLHNLLFLTLYSEKNEIKIYVLFGWGFPICFIIPWILLKIFYEDELCWTMHGNKMYQLVMHAPIVVSTLINFILFIKIVHILLIKLNSMYIQQRKMKYRRLIRSTLILMPLFGVPYTFSILTWYAASKNITHELMWMAFDQTFTSFQGFFVAFLYCLLNTEVQTELKKMFLSKFKLPQDNHFLMNGLSRSSGANLTQVTHDQRRSTH